MTFFDIFHTVTIFLVNFRAFSHDPLLLHLGKKTLCEGSFFIYNKCYPLLERFIQKSGYVKSATAFIGNDTVIW